MTALASNYKASNPGSKTQVVNFEPRPLMHLTPALGSSDCRVMPFNFIEAVTRLPLKFSRKDLSKIMQAVSGKFKGQLRSLFVAISDDDRVATRRRHHESESSSGTSGSSSGSGSEAEDGPDPSAQHGSRSASVRVGSETQERTSTSSGTRPLAPPPPPLPPSGRGSKRGHSSPKKSKSKSHRR